MEIQQKYTISEATAFLGFKSRSTINSRTKDKGTKSISYETDDSGNKVISILELERVFPAKYAAAIKNKNNTDNTSAEHSKNAQQNTPKNTNNTIQLQHKVEMLEQELDSTKNALNKSEEREADLSKKLDKTQDSLQISLRQLEDTRDKSLDKPPEKKKGFWGSLFG